MSAAGFCKVMGAILVVVGVWGFITGDRVLVFHVNALHNVLHLVSGLAALACGFAGENAARAFAIAFGSAYGLVAILGFARVDWVIRALHLNPADNWLHLVLAAAFLFVGLTRTRSGKRPAVAGAG